MFKAAAMDTIVFMTQHIGHAGEIIRDYELNRCHGIVVVSGDGLLNEVANALLKRKDWNSVRSVPLGVIPAGNAHLW